MSRTTSNTKAVQFPAAIHVSAIRVGLALAIAASLFAFAVRAGAQQHQVGSGNGISTQSVASTFSDTSK